MTGQFLLVAMLLTPQQVAPVITKALIVDAAQAVIVNIQNAKVKR